jgi:N6-L-threonylcarbamoyladenine synthase
MKILAIETSCDETAAAVMEKKDNDPFVLTCSAVVASQAKLHEKYGGVYPEVASREHIRQILPVIAEALELPLTERDRLPLFSLKDIDHLAVTVGPGLIGSLLVGTNTVAALGLASGKPIIAVNHLAGHIYANFIRHNYTYSAESQPKSVATQYAQVPPRFPLMSLIVSGGHTLLVYMKEHYSFEIIGQTRDDAAGEAFDKVAKLLGLGYPGGPLVSKLAATGDRFAYNFPIGFEHEETLDFSFSGLKTAVLRVVQKESQPLNKQAKANIAASFERAVIEALLLKTTHALNAHPVNDFLLGGGVAANAYLRERLSTLLAHRVPSINLHIPPISLCTDNAQVIGAAAAFSPLTPTPAEALNAVARPVLSTSPP